MASREKPKKPKPPPPLFAAERIGTYTLKKGKAKQSLRRRSTRRLRGSKKGRK